MAAIGPSSSDDNESTPVPSGPVGKPIEQEKPTGSSYLFNADAQAVLEDAPTLHDGLDLLASAYGSKKWDNPLQAKETAAKYVQLLSYRFKDDPTFNSEDTIGMSPVDLRNITGNGDTEQDKKLDHINQWELANQKFLDGTDDPDYLMRRDKLKRSITDTASQLRTQINTADEGFLADKAYRAALGLTGGILKLTGAESYVKSLQEHIDPQQNEEFGSKIASIGGTVIGATAASAAALATGQPELVGPIVYYGLTGAGEVKDSYKRALENTGDSGRALIALGLQTGNQALQAAAGSLVIGSAGAKIGEAIFGTGEQVIAPLLKAAGKDAGALGGTTLLSTPVGTAASLEENPKLSQGDIVSQSAKSLAKKDTWQTAVAATVFGLGISGVSHAAGDIRVEVDRTINPDIPESSPGNFIHMEADPQAEINPDPIIKNTTGAPVNAEKTAQNTADLNLAKTPAFTTADGSKYFMTPDGTSTSRISGKDGTVTNPLDRTVYVDEKAANIISGLKVTLNRDGTEPQITTNGKEVFIKNIKNNPLVDKGYIVTSGRKGDTVAIPIQDSPSEESYPLQINKARNPNGNSLVYQSHLGEKITQVNETPSAFATVPEAEQQLQETPVQPQQNNEGSSVGAQFSGDLNTRKTADRVLSNPNVPQEVKDILQQHLFDTKYLVTPHAVTNDAAELYIAQKGIAGATSDILNDESSLRGLDRAGVARKLYNFYVDGVNRAKAVGDNEAVGRLSQTSADVAAALMRHGTETAQTLSFFNEIAKDLNPDMYVAGVANRAKNRALERELTKNGVTPEEHNLNKNTLNQTNTELENLRVKGEELKQKAQAEVKPSKNGEPVKEIKGDPEEFLQPEDKARAKDLQKKQQSLKKKVEPIEKAAADTVDDLAPQKEELKNLLEVAKKVEGSNREEVFEKIKEVEKEIDIKANPAYVKPNRDWGDFIHSYRIANLISGLSTQGKKVVGDVSNVVGSTLGLTAAGITPLHFEEGKILPRTGFGEGGFDPLKGASYLRNFFSQVRQTAPDIWKETVFTGKNLIDVPDEEGKHKDGQYGRNPFDTKDIINNHPDFSKLGKYSKAFEKVITFPGYFGRSLMGTENTYYRSNREAFADAIVREEIRKGLSGEELRNKVAERLYNTAEAKAGALKNAQDETEMLSKVGISRTDRQTRIRAAEIIQRQRPVDIQYRSSTFAKGELYSSPPEGYIGAILRGPIRKLIEAKVPNPWGVTIQPFKPILLFTTVAGNIFEFGRGYVPLASYKYAEPSMDPLRRQIEFGKQIVGTTALAGYFGLASHFNNDKDPYFMLWGSKGSGQEGRKDAYSIKIGDHNFKFGDTVFAFPLGGIGETLQTLRDNPESDIKSTLTSYIGGSLDSFTKHGFISGLGDIFDIITGHIQGHQDRTSKIEDILATGTINYAKSLIPLSGTLRTISKIADNPVESYNNLTSKLVSNIPFAQAYLGMPALNVFGDPIGKNWEDRVDAISTFYHHRELDPQARWLAENGYHAEIPWSVSIPEARKGVEGSEDIRAERTKDFGSMYASVHTPSERHQLVEAVGPKIREIVKQYQNTYGSSKFDPDVQKELSHDIKAVIKSTKIELWPPN